MHIVVSFLFLLLPVAVIIEFLPVVDEIIDIIIVKPILLLD